MKEITIKIPAEIVENNELDSTEKLLLSLSFSYIEKSGFNILTNKEIAELFSINPNTVGKYRNSLIEKGYETKTSEGIQITDEYKNTKPRDNRTILLPPDIYKEKINSGAKLLWAEYNSLSKKGKVDAFPSREFLAKRFNCSKDTITNWLKKLNESGLFSSFELPVVKGKRQRRVKTIDFNSSEVIQVPVERRREVWNEYLEPKSYLKKRITSDKQAWEFTKEVIANVRDAENVREVVSSIIKDIPSKLSGDKMLEKLGVLIEEQLLNLLKS